MNGTQPNDRDFLVFEGTVVKCSRGGFYTVACASGTIRHTVLAKRGGRLSVHHIRLTEGDRVRVEISPYDTTRGRIIRRL
jgi:translation initiation factor IF-1